MPALWRRREGSSTQEVKKYCVYKHTCPLGRVYIGITSRDPKSRWQSGHGYKGNTYFTRAIEKYGWEHFTHEILADGLTEQEAKAMEISLIAKHRSNERQFGFNISSGGESKSGVPISDEQKAIISSANLGKVVTGKTREKLRVAALRCWKNESHVNHMREINLGEKNPQFGKHRTDEEKLARGAKPVIQYTADGDIVDKYISAHEASEKTNINRQTISMCCKGAFKQAGGYVWRYA